MISTCPTRGRNVSLSAVSGTDHVVIRDGGQMAWHLWKHRLVLMKQADKLWLWPALQWQTKAHCISSQILPCFDHRSNIGQKEKQWPENTDFGEVTAPWDQLFLFPAKGLGNLWFQKKQLAYSKTQDGTFCKYCALFLPISLSLGVQPPG